MSLITEPILLDLTGKEINNAILRKQKIKLTEQSTAGWHNSIYRGKYLGNEVTAEQFAVISAGTFEDLYIGDYWTINNINWRIAHFDYWLYKGDTSCTTHHIIILPDTNLYNAKMNTDNITTGGYLNSLMKTENLANALTIFENAFGSSHILNHRNLFTNAVSSGQASGWAWVDSKIDLMNECMVYGQPVWGQAGHEIGIDITQLALFTLAPEFIQKQRAYYWLRSVYSAAGFCYVNYSGNATYTNASSSGGVRPAAGICG